MSILFFIVGIVTNQIMYHLHRWQFEKMFGDTIQTTIPVLKWFNGRSCWFTAQVFGLVDGIVLGILIVVPLIWFGII